LRRAREGQHVIVHLARLGRRLSRYLDLALARLFAVLLRLHDDVGEGPAHRARAVGRELEPGYLAVAAQLLDLDLLEIGRRTALPRLIGAGADIERARLVGRRHAIGI